MAQHERQKVSKQSVNYRPGRFGGRRCGTCGMFNGRSQSCDLVRGKIYSRDTCDKWVTK